MWLQFKWSIKHEAQKKKKNSFVEYPSVETVKARNFQLVSFPAALAKVFSTGVVQYVMVVTGHFPVLCCPLSTE